MSKLFKNQKQFGLTFKKATMTKHKCIKSSLKKGFYVRFPLWSDCHLSLKEIKGLSI